MVGFMDTTLDTTLEYYTLLRFYVHTVLRCSFMQLCVHVPLYLYIIISLRYLLKLNLHRTDTELVRGRAQVSVQGLMVGRLRAKYTW